MSHDPNVVRNGLYTKPYYTVATLPAAASCQGCDAFVTDAMKAPQTNFGDVVEGGGTIKTRVLSDGTNWRIA